MLLAQFARCCAPGRTTLPRGRKTRATTAAIKRFRRGSPGTRFDGRERNSQSRKARPGDPRRFEAAATPLAQLPFVPRAVGRTRRVTSISSTPNVSSCRCSETPRVCQRRLAGRRRHRSPSADGPHVGCAEAGRTAFFRGASAYRPQLANRHNDGPSMSKAAFLMQSPEITRQPVPAQESNIITGVAVRGNRSPTGLSRASPAGGPQAAETAGENEL